MTKYELEISDDMKWKIKSINKLLKIADLELKRSLNVCHICGAYRSSCYCAMNGWRSVEDELPEAHQDVLIFANKPRNHIIIRSFSAEEIKRKMDKDKITHWMPLPNEPDV